MKFKIQTQIFKQVASLLKSINTSADLYDITNSILFRIETNQLILTAVGNTASTKIVIDLSSSIKDVSFLVDAKQIIHATTSQSTEELALTISGDDIENGVGFLSVKGTSKVKIALKSIHKFPEFENIDGEFIKINEPQQLIRDLEIASVFIDKEAINYLGGIFINEKFIIANKKVSAGFIRHNYNLPLTGIILPKDSIKYFKYLDNLKIKKSNFLVLSGNIGQCYVEIKINTIQDDFPFKKLLTAAKQMTGASDEDKDLSLSCRELQEVIRRISGFTNSLDENIKIEVDYNKTTIIFAPQTSQTCEDTEEINSVCNKTFEFSVGVTLLSEIIKIYPKITDEDNLTLHIKNSLLYYIVENRYKILLALVKER